MPGIGCCSLNSSGSKMSFFSRILFKKLKCMNTFIGKRQLMSDAVLRIDSYLNNCAKYRIEYPVEKRDAFIADMKDQLLESSEVKTDDLITMLHLIDNDDDIQVCTDMAVRYQTAKYNITRGFHKGFFFGPPFLRMLHHYKKVDTAMSMMEDKIMRGFLYHASGLVVYMDLLYETKNYEKCVQFYEELDTIKSQNLLLKNHLTLAMASLYQMNTSEALRKATDLIHKSFHNENRVTSSRSSGYGAALALKQHDPELAVEILELSTDYKFLQNLNSGLMIMAQAELGNAEEVMPMLEMFCNQDNTAELSKPIKLFPDCLDAIDKMVERLNNEELKETFTRHKTHLQNADLINSVTLFEKLNEKIYNSKKGYLHFKGIRRNNYFHLDRQRY